MLNIIKCLLFIYFLSHSHLTIENQNVKTKTLKFNIKYIFKEIRYFSNLKINIWDTFYGGNLQKIWKKCLGGLIIKTKKIMTTVNKNRPSWKNQKVPLKKLFFKMQTNPVINNLIIDSTFVLYLEKTKKFGNFFIVSRRKLSNLTRKLS